MSFTEHPTPPVRKEENYGIAESQYNTLQQLNDSEYKYYQLFNSIDEGYCVIDILFDDNNKPYDYCYLEVNDAFEKQTGLINPVGKCISEMAPTHEQYWFDIYGEIAITGKPLRFQRWAEEFQRHYDVYAFRISKPGEKKVAVLFNDVTEKMRAEENLAFLFDITQTLINTNTLEDTIRVTAEKMGKYLRLSSFIFSRIDLRKNESEVLYNWRLPHLPEITGIFPVNNYLGKEIQLSQQQGVCITVDDISTDRRVDGGNYKNLNIGSFIKVPLQRNGEWQFSISVCRDQPYTWRSDEIKLVQEAVTHIWTSLEKKRMERDLAFNEERLRLAVETGNVGICDLNYQTGKSISNQVRYHMYGMLPREEAVPASEFYSRTHPDDVEALKKKLTEGIETEGKFTAEFRVVHPDGTVHWIAETGHVIEWEEGKPRRVICTLLDITERKMAEIQKDEFFNIASHELKTPVTSIKGFTYLLEAKFREDNDEYSVELVKQLNGQVNRLNKLISNMLDAARAAGGRLDYQIEKFDVLLLLEEVVQDMQYTTRHQINLFLSQIPLIDGDKMRLRQVFTNVISNAIKFTPVSSVQPPTEIVIKTSYTEKELRISVSDNGIGMSAGTVSKLFQRFFRSDAPETHHYPGLGLGLYISKEIMLHHGGNIYATSQKGKGSVFTLALPVANK